MKIRVALTIDLDPHAWAQNNGQIVDAAGRFTLAEVRDDVRSYVLTCLQGAPMLEDADAEVTLS